MLRQLVYVSRERISFTEDVLRRLFAHSRVANPRRHISGIVAYYKKGFFQVMEGDEDTLTELFDTIYTDPRHEVLFATMHPIPHREFEGWTMALPDYHSTEGRADDGLLPYNTLAYDESVFRGKARKLFRSFNAGEWRNKQSVATSVC